MLEVIADIKLGSGEDSIREVWLGEKGEKIGTVILRGEGCHDKDLNEILRSSQSLYDKRERNKKK